MNLPKTLFLTFFLFVAGLNAQAIRFEAAPLPNLPSIYNGDIAFGDIDGDGDNDCLQVGQSPIVTILLLNDGEGVFTENMDTPFPNLFSGNAELVDLDGDQDLDVALSGELAGIPTLKLYLNDGTGSFQEISDTGLPGISGGDLAFGDLDGDGDEDLLLGGTGINGDGLIQLFLNDGSGAFTELTESLFVASGVTVVQLFDLDGDDDLDVLIKRQDDEDVNLIDLYRNDGTSNFTPIEGSLFASLSGIAVATADSDNDGDLDIFINGQNNEFTAECQLYLNDGAGNFALLPTTTFTGSFAGIIVPADFDRDNDVDVLMVGSEQGGLPNIFNIVYENQGNNIFTPSDTLGGEYIAAAAAADVNGDGFEDVMIHGFADGINLYLNNSEGTSNTADLGAAGKGMTVFPNPSAGEVTIAFEEMPLRGGVLTVHDVQGRTVYEEAVLPALRLTTRLPVGAGLYIVSFRNGEGWASRKVRVE